MNFFKQKRQNRRKKLRPKGKVSGCCHSCTNKVFCCICSQQQQNEAAKDEVAAKKEQGRLPRQQSQLSLLSFKDSPYRVRKPYPRITITWSHSSSSININNTNIKKTIVSPSPSSTSMKLGSSISHSSSSVSLLSPLSPIEDCSVATGCVDERKPFDIDAWILSYSRQENTSPALKRPSTEDLHESHLTVKQALSCEADLRVQNLETGASVVSCNDASSVSRDDEHDKEITKMSRSSSQASLTDKIISKWAGITVPDIYTLIKRTLNTETSKNSLDLSQILQTSRTQFSSKPAEEKDHVTVDRVRPSKSPSLHNLHTEWDESIVNIEVLLGLKKPKNLKEAMSIKKEFGDDIPSWYPTSEWSDSVSSSSSLIISSMDDSAVDDSGFASSGGNTGNV